MTSRDIKKSKNAKFLFQTCKYLYLLLWQMTGKWLYMMIWCYYTLYPAKFSKIYLVQCPLYIYLQNLFTGSYGLCPAHGRGRFKFRRAFYHWDSLVFRIVIKWKDTKGYLTIIVIIIKHTWAGKLVGKLQIGSFFYPLSRSIRPFESYLGSYWGQIKVEIEESNVPFPGQVW